MRSKADTLPGTKRERTRDQLLVSAQSLLMSEGARSSRTIRAFIDHAQAEITETRAIDNLTLAILRTRPTVALHKIQTLQHNHAVTRKCVCYHCCLPAILSRYHHYLISFLEDCLDFMQNNILNFLHIFHFN